MRMLWWWLLPMLLGCGPDIIYRAKAPEAPTQGLTKCKVAASNENPLVTEWSASEKANLEGLIEEAGVVVAYSGCEMRILPQCKVGGRYGWQRTTSATDAFDIRSEDDLYAKLPLGAVTLSGELEHAGRLSMQTTVTGQLKLQGVDATSLDPQGACDGATHVLGALSVGAFKLRSGARFAARGGVDTPMVDGGAGTDSSEDVLRASGDPSRCREASDEAPHDQCRSPIQVFLWPLPGTQKKRGPLGTIPVSFYDQDNEIVWEVIADGKPVCETPCEQFVPTTSRVMMREKHPRATSSDDDVDLPDLLKYQTAERLEARAEAAPDTAWVTAIALTAGGGAVWIAGVAVTLSVCTQDDAAGNKPAGCGVGVAMTPFGATSLVVGGVMLLFTNSADLELTVIEDTKVSVGPGGLGVRF